MRLWSVSSGDGDGVGPVVQNVTGTKNYALVYDGDSQKGIYAYTDSDWAADKIKCQSITGYFFNLANSIFSWCTHAQKTVALSSTEAKYMAMSDCSQQAMWIKTLLSELGLTLGAIPIYGDTYKERHQLPRHCGTRT